MGTGKTRDIPSGLESVRRRFECWRKTRPTAFPYPRLPVGGGGDGGR